MKGCGVEVVDWSRFLFLCAAVFSFSLLRVLLAPWCVMRAACSWCDVVLSLLAGGIGVFGGLVSHLLSRMYVDLVWPMAPFLMCWRSMS